MCNSNRLLITLLTCAVRGEDGRGTLGPEMSDEEIKALYDLAKKHDLAHLAGAAAEGLSPQEKMRYKPFVQAAVKAVYRYEWLAGEQNKIFAVLERLEIPYIPLKGAVIRELYREPWHRLSCDIDVLIPEESLEKAISVYENEMSYVRGMRSPHEVSLTAPNGVHLELHFDIDEVYVDRDELWADAKPLSSEGFRRALSADMLVLNHISHMAKHFITGGCGLRPFLDLWLMKEKLALDKKRLTALLESHGLAEFGKAVFGLVDVWFDGKPANETERALEEYILPAGVYGDLDNKISVTLSKGEGRLAYAMHRVFPSRSSLTIFYPVLESHPVLLPVCWVRRWVRLLRAGKLKQVKREYEINRSLDADALNSTADLLKSLNLKA